MNDLSQQLAEQVVEAHASKRPLRILAGNTKAFYGRDMQGSTLDMSQHSGIINYEPTELVITARAGTPLSHIQNTLAEHNQMLGFEPPAYGEAATLGGTIACNLSGPARPFQGAARDFTLGSRIINGKGDVLQFGGEVMKNVAGYDVSRLMCGAMGTLGVILDISLKVVPRIEAERTLVLDMPVSEAIPSMQRFARKGHPLSASAYVDGRLYLRLASHENQIQAAHSNIGGEVLDKGAEFWTQLNEQTLEFFNDERPLWRLSLAAITPELPLAGDTLYDWGGALRWLKTTAPADEIRHCLNEKNGHAILFRRGQPDIAPFHQLSPGLLQLHRTLKRAFDPACILNPGRMYEEI